MEAKALLAVLVCLTVKVCQTDGEQCHDPFSDSNLDCDNGCCGTTDYQYCCLGSTDVEEYSEVGEIIGGIIGGLIFLAIVVSIIVAICCCLRSQAQRSSPGTVLTPSTAMQGQTNMTMLPVANITTYPTSNLHNNQYPTSPGNQLPHAGFQSPTPGYQPPSDGFQHPTAGFQNPIEGYQPQAAGFQHQTAGFQNPTEGYQPQGAGFQQQNAGYEPPSYSQATSKPYSEPSAPFIGD